MHVCMPFRLADGERLPPSEEQSRLKKTRILAQGTGLPSNYWLIQRIFRLVEHNTDLWQSFVPFWGTSDLLKQ